MTRIVVAGASGWVGRELVKAVAAAPDLALAGAVSRSAAGQDAGEAAGAARLGIVIAASLEEALAVPSDVVIDYTKPHVVKGHTLTALKAGRHVVPYLVEQGHTVTNLDRAPLGLDGVTDLDVEVEPWAVVVRHGRWYLLCRLPERDVVRAYRVDRVRSVTLLDLRFRAPDGLDPVAALEEHLASGWDHPTEVLVHAPLDRVHWLPRTLGRLEDTGDGRTRIVGSTSNVPDYAAGLARIPFPLTVVGGDELRDAVARLAARLTDSLDDGPATR